jgi:hypothetical protein
MRGRIVLARSDPGNLEAGSLSFFPQNRSLGARAENPDLAKVLNNFALLVLAEGRRGGLVFAARNPVG